jgi:hypothetical protein
VEVVGLRRRIVSTAGVMILMVSDGWKDGIFGEHSVRCLEELAPQSIAIMTIIILPPININSMSGSF